MSIGAQLGFHRYSLNSKQLGQALSIEAELAKDRNYFLGRGVEADFVQSMLSRRGSEIWSPTRVQLKQADILNSPD